MKEIPTDSQLLRQVYEYGLQKSAEADFCNWLFIETAGGVHSPSPTGTTQADLYMPLRCPVILIGDSNLGGISTTISAFESLKLRGYDVEALLMFRDREYKNHEYLSDYFRGNHPDIPVIAICQAPPSTTDSPPKPDTAIMSQLYDAAGQNREVRGILNYLRQKHDARIARLESMATEAHKKIWYPFTQQSLLKPENITTIDAARGDFFHTLIPQNQDQEEKSAGAPPEKTLLQPSFDGSASWWTQGLGHSNPSLTLAAAYAAGRYGHVMFAEAIHEPALALAEALLEGMQNRRLRRVFYSDNGSTGVEVAVKMALRATRMRYGWAADVPVGVVGLKGGYHGDTMGAMDCAEPSVFNEKVEWYEGKGVWLDYPTVICAGGTWVVQLPEAMRHEGVDQVSGSLKFETLADVFDLENREAQQVQFYKDYIEKELKRHVDHGRKFGALLMEPVVIGAGGMLLVDPLFQRALVNVVRRSAELFSGKEEARLGPDLSENGDDGGEISWRGLPVIFDEVFTGLYRLGRFTASSFLQTHADISVHAKLLTGGVVPLCATLASETIFRAFASDDKTDALLHGHSYTAHAVGCQVALESLRQLRAMDEGGQWGWAKGDDAKSDENSTETETSGPKRPWGHRKQLGRKPQLAEKTKQPLPAKGSKESKTTANTTPEPPWSIWSPTFLECVSAQKGVAGVWALGSVLSIHMDAGDGGAGYKSTAAVRIRDALRQRCEPQGGEGEEKGANKVKKVVNVPWNVHSRVLGNVLYIMGSQTSREEDIRGIEGVVREIITSID